MRCLTLLLALTSVPGLTATAHATPISAGVYTLQNASVNGYSLTGTVTLNGSGNVTASNLTYNNASFNNPGLPTFNQVSSTNTYNGLSQNYLSSTGNSGQIAFYFNTFADANGFLDLCIGSAQCGTAGGTTAPSNLQIYGFYNSSTGTSNPGLSATNLGSGYLMQGSTPALTSTPEPSTLVMLATGALGFAGAAGRRLLLA